MQEPENINKAVRAMAVLEDRPALEADKWFVSSFGKAFCSL